ncbi:MAG: VOC family protein [Woeseiaceae bacterium]|nr:VOC family protein [Woeseiaceae bacterium]
MAATRVHHVNFVVRDLDAAAERLQTLLGIGPFERVDHAPRGAHVAHAAIGDAFLVLVCPYDDDSVPGRFLAQHGEGFFLLSFGTTSLDAELERLLDAGVPAADSSARPGIRDWRVADVGEWFGVRWQFVEDDADERR